MNSNRLEGKWNQIKGDFKMKYGDLTDNDTTYADFEFDKMLGSLQKKVGKTREQLKEDIDRWEFR